jgi:nucleoside-diphosphate-sugar epimerase
MNSLTKKKIFLTGATGYIGKAVLKQLILSNYEVKALVRDDTKGKEMEVLEATYVVGNMTNEEILEKEACGMDYIIHCARDRDAAANELEKFCVNVLIKIAKENAKSKPCTFVYTSGTMVLGQGDEVKDEFYKIENPETYIKWRTEIESIVLDYSDNTPNLTTIVIRPTWVYGNGSGLITEYLKACKRDSVVYQVGDGNSYCNFIHLNDLAKLYVLLVEKNEAGIFHATDNVYLQIKEIVEALKNYLKVESKIISYDEAMNLYGFAAFSHIFNQKVVTKRSLEIGWEPEHKSFISDLDNLFNELKSI